MKNLFLSLAIIILFIGCNNHKMKHQAVGKFEATEIIISSMATGIINQFDVKEGETINKGLQVGYIDSTQLYLQKLQLLSKRKTLKVSHLNINKQVKTTREEIMHIKTEKERIKNLLKGDAATEQQLDAMDAKLKISKGRLSAQINSLQTNINGLNEKSSTVDIQIAQIEDRLSKYIIINPIKGVVLKKYAEQYEFVTPARPLYKIADMDSFFLRAYITSDQLSKIKLGQTAKVFCDFGKRESKKYSGKVVWVSNKAEFTPKTVQTRNERANLVYAVKIAVKNDGYLKIGMYGEVDFNE